MVKNANYQDKPWLASYEPGISEHIQYEEVFLPEKLRQMVRKYPDRMALCFQGYRMTYGELGEMADRFAACLFDFGIRKGDRVAILLPNVIPCVAAYQAVLKIGGVVVMNNPLYTDRELEHQFNDSGSKCLITLDLLAERMIGLREKTGIRQIVYTSIGDYLPFPKNLLFPLLGKKKGLAADVKPAEDVYKWKDVIRKYSPMKTSASVEADDLAMLQYTGGTTGVSKGVMLTHGNISYQLQQLSGWFHNMLSEGAYETMMGALPFFHVMGLTTSMNFALFIGWGNILVPKPQPNELLEALRKFKPSFASLVPTMYIGIVNHPDIDAIDLTFIKACFSGSAPLPVEIINEFQRRTGVYIAEGFGLTESCPVTHMNPFDGKKKIGSIGLPLAETECRIVDLETGEKDVPLGESGELIVKGPQVMKGYWGRPEATAQTLRNGWLYTGDIAKMDEEGYFFIVDRKKDMILSGGYNVYPRDIDEVFFEHPKVEEACAIGVPHPTRGEQIKIFVVLKQGEQATEEEMISFCKDKLAKYKWPTGVEFRDELPKSTVGKVLRKELRKEEAASAETDNNLSAAA